MDLSVEDAARLLAVSEDAVYRWIRERSLAAHRVRHQYRLNSVELQEWAAAHGHRLSGELFAAGAKDSAGLVAALERGGIHRGITGAAREKVIASLAALPGIPDGVDRALLRELLLAREALGCTSVGGGIALPHPRDPLVLRIREPRVLLCFLEASVDFDAADGNPVRTLFLLLSPSVNAHLELLAKLARALQDAPLRELLRRAAPDPEILGRLGELEGRGARA